MSVYDWKDVPKWVKFVATDLNKVVYGYENKPYVILDQMFVGGNYIKLKLKPCEIYHWKDSIEERPSV